MKYPLTFYTNRFLDGNQVGAVRVFLLPVIFIRPEYKHDQGLLAHEQVHVSQAWGNLFPPIHAIRYALSEKYRLKCEVEAYRKQLQVNKETGYRGGFDYAPFYAKFIAEDYNISITPEAALGLLK